MKIPTFTSTEESLAFGKTATPKQRATLHKLKGTIKRRSTWLLRLNFFVGLAIGIILIALAIIWGQDLDTCSDLLLAGGLMILLGSTKQEIVNEEKTYEN